MDGLDTPRPRYLDRHRPRPVGDRLAVGRPSLSQAEVRRRLAEAARMYAIAARQLGVSETEAEAAVRAQLRR